VAFGAKESWALSISPGRYSGASLPYSEGVSVGGRGARAEFALLLTELFSTRIADFFGLDVIPVCGHLVDLHPQ